MVPAVALPLQSGGEVTKGNKAGRKGRPGIGARTGLAAPMQARN
jgi:hypothetical protein